MGRCMLESHQSQCQEIGEAGGLGAIGLAKKLSDAHLEATLQFERESPTGPLDSRVGLVPKKALLRP